MKRRLFSILSALSLLLFVAVVGLWVRSYWRADLLSRHDGTLHRGIVSTCGRLSLWWAIVHSLNVVEGADGWNYRHEAAVPVEEYRYVLLADAYDEFMGFGYLEWG